MPYPLLTIRPEQMQLFEVQAEQRFAARVETRLRTEAPQIASRGEDLPRLIRESRAKIQALGFTGDAELTDLVLARLMLGADFDRDATKGWIRDILEDPSAKPAGKAEAILTTARSRLYSRK